MNAFVEAERDPDLVLATFRERRERTCGVARGEVPVAER